MIISKNKIKCPFCSNNSYLKNIENSHKIYRCYNCYLLFVHPLPKKKRGY